MRKRVDEHMYAHACMHVRVTAVCRVGVGECLFAPTFSSKLDSGEHCMRLHPAAYKRTAVCT